MKLGEASDLTETRFQTVKLPHQLAVSLPPQISRLNMGRGL